MNKKCKILTTHQTTNMAKLNLAKAKTGRENPKFDTGECLKHR
jgi:hypothetical protein